MKPVKVKSSLLIGCSQTLGVNVFYVAAAVKQLKKSFSSDDLNPEIETKNLLFSAQYE